MAQSGIARIDELLRGHGEEILPGEEDREAVGLIQDLLIGHGFHLPGVLGGSRGSYGPKTAGAVSAFQRSCDLPDTGSVDADTLQAIVAVPAPRPLASQGYLTLVLDLPFSGITRLMSITSQFEGTGRFSAINRNTDHAGMSFGLIQWAQKPGRLHELLAFLESFNPEIFRRVFGDGDCDLVQGLLAHVGGYRGGVDEHGRTTNPDFDLVENPWLGRFKRAALPRELQVGQVICASDAFYRSLEKLRHYAPMLKSERAIAFMLDLANQHGDGGARNIFEHVFRPVLTESELLESVSDESVARVRHQFGNGAIAESTFNRREAFRTSSLLSDEPFES
jgi:hypothetical protein